MNPTLAQKTCGVLLHPTSLPGPHDIGDFGPEAYRFIDFLNESGQRWWQMLPIGPVGPGNSPYQSPSAFAGGLLFISLEQLARDGFLSRYDIPKSAVVKNPGGVDYAQAKKIKETSLQKVFRKFKKTNTRAVTQRFSAFCRQHRAWLDDYALFAVLDRRFRGRPWSRWEPDLKWRKPEALARIEKDEKDQIQFHKFVQFLFFMQWNCLRTYGRKRGVGFIGDLPIFVAHHSVDVWKNPDLFFLDENGEPTVVAGVPPDYFSETGQHWGNPLYRWDVMEKQNFSWWSRRLAHKLNRFDVVRLDHFVGFERYWEIPASERTAEKGRWVKGPGAALFQHVFNSIPSPSFIAEDLGLVTPEVTALRQAFGFPGMRVLQFGLDGDPQNGNAPENISSACVFFTGTHDNDTTAGWFRKLSREDQKKVILLIGGHEKSIHWDMIRTAMASPANTVIIPAQDILGLGSSARMNRPGTKTGNWKWRLEHGKLDQQLAQTLLRLAQKYGRAKK